MKNILIVTEMFVLGGLETNILDTTKMLKEAGFQIFIATSDRSDLSLINSYISDSLILKDIDNPIGNNVINCYEQLVSFISENSIEVMHIHPHLSFLPASLAAAQCQIPFMITIHSPLNLGNSYGFVYRLFLREYLFPKASKIFAVSDEAKKAVEQINSEVDVEVLSNSVDTDVFNPVDWKENNDLVVVSRLDADKISGIKKAVDFFIYSQKNESLNHETLMRIVGDGNGKDELVQWINERGFSNNIIFEGKSNNINELMSNAKIVFGMGRVVLEAASKNIPTILCGYDGLKGFVKNENIDELFKVNFSGRTSDNVSFELLDVELNFLLRNEAHFQYENRTWIQKNVSLVTLSTNYISTIEKLSNSNKISDPWYEDILYICKMNTNDNVLDISGLSAWLKHAKLNLTEETKISLSISSELQKMNIEKGQLLQQLGMTRQHLHDLNTYKLENEQALKKQIEELQVQSKGVQDTNNKLMDQIELILKKDVNLQDKQEAALDQETIDSLLATIHRLSQLKSIKLVSFMRRFKHQFINGSNTEKKHFLNWFSRKISKLPTENVSNNYNPMAELWSVIEKRDHQVLNVSNKINFSEGEDYINALKNRGNYYKSFLESAIQPETLEILAIMKRKNYCGIVVYPAAIKWEPVQRPQQLLRVMAKKGYLVFFCDDSPAETYKINEIEENFFVVNREEYLLPALRSQFCIVLITWLLQTAWSEQLPHKLVWYDLVDQLEFFSLYDENMKMSHEEMLREASIVSYSAANLRQYMNGRNDSIYLPNGVTSSDFAKEIDYLPDDLRVMKPNNGPVIGYYGAIEEWFDVELINRIATQNPNWNIVLIGTVGIEENLFENKNISLLGQKPYLDLYKYIHYFDVAIIPFKINDLTNCVSPVKFFEYQAAGKPVVSTGIAEMLQYESESVKIANNSDEFILAINQLLSLNKASVKNDSLKLVNQNEWLSRFEVIEEKISSSINSLFVYSNYDPSGRVASFAATFLGFKGSNFFSGGAERYLIDLVKLCTNMDLNMSIYQYGDYPWIRKFKHIDIISVSRDNIDTSEFTVQRIKSFNRLFFEQIAERTELNIYSAYFESWPLAAHPSIGISHGVSWDGPTSKYQNGSQFWEANRRFIEGAKSCEQLISVDTNTANWLQTIDYDIGRKTRVIQNYVDLNEFQPRFGYLDKRDKVIILYPRRLYEARGLYLILDVLDTVLEKYPFVEFHFVGKGFESDTKHVEKKVKKWDGRVKWYWLDPDRMPEAYHNADITLIPTLYSEGTSLSCLEAMASGNAIISTRIGGLTDLVINNFNGLLISPDSIELLKAMEQLLEDYEKLKRFKKRSVEVAQEFSKEKWANDWKEVLMQYATQYKSTSLQSKLIEFYVYSYKTIKQKTKDLIKKHLIVGNLVYVYEKKETYDIVKSFGRLQFLKWDSEQLSDPDLIVAEEAVSTDLVSKIDILICEE